jgi:hypothetical protein
MPNQQKKHGRFTSTISTNGKGKIEHANSHEMNLEGTSCNAPLQSPVSSNFTPGFPFLATPGYP